MNTTLTESGHSETARSIWVFTPSRTAPEDLEAILVQRHDLLKDAVERVRESALTAHKHHLLFVGPRGCGKTHLVTLIVSRITADTEASTHLRLAWLNEDETCTSLLELLIKIHTALEKRYPGEFRAEKLSQAYELKPDAAFEFVAKHLLKTLDSKTLVVVTENLDALFESMGEAGQKQLRAFIQEHPQLAIVATAQRLVEDLSDRTSPFFGFFQTEHLKPLSIEQATTLLQNIAHRQGKKEVGDFLATSRGRSRVRALHHLSGGNHRIYIVLSQFITRESMDALIGPFLKMVDELTPYYQERIRWLPPLQRKIVEMLCTCETTVPVKEIARRLFSTPQTISSQLQSLREKGYVESNQRGREFLYEISEPLMRICVEVKENQNTQPLRLLVDFLRVWYDDLELKRRLGLCLPESSAFGYLYAAVERNDKEGNLRFKMLVEDILREEDVKFDSDTLKQLASIFPEELFIAVQCAKENDEDGARESVAEALMSLTTDEKKAGLLLLRGQVKEQEGDVSAAIADYSRIIELPGASSFVIAMALCRRGTVYAQQEDNTAAIADYTRVIELPDAPRDQVALSLILRGTQHLKAGAKSETRVDLEAFLRLASEKKKPAVIVVHLTLAALHFIEGAWDKGFTAIESSLSLGTESFSHDLPPPVDVIEVLFTAGLNQEGRRSHASTLHSLYAKHSASAVLGEALVKHLGSLFAKGEPWPASDNLDQWLKAWEQAVGDAPEFKLPLRLLRTGINFIKSGGNDAGILLSLTSPERSILRQALGLETAKDEGSP